MEPNFPEGRRRPRRSPVIMLPEGMGDPGEAPTYLDTRPAQHARASRAIAARRQLPLSSLRQYDVPALDLLSVEAHQRLAMRTFDRKVPDNGKPNIRVAVAVSRFLECDKACARCISTADRQIPVGNGRQIVDRWAGNCVDDHPCPNKVGLSGRPASFYLQVLGRGFAAITDHLVFDMLTFIERAEPGALDG
jgi:hypothetical protein